MIIKNKNSVPYDVVGNYNLQVSAREEQHKKKAREHNSRIVAREDSSIRGARGTTTSTNQKQSLRWTRA
jgi:hypothetical protein